jgi:hypothetical protein
MDFAAAANGLRRTRIQTSALANDAGRLVTHT